MILFLISLKIGFTGDVNMGRTLGQKLLADTTLYVFVNLDSIMNYVDLNIVNLEGVVSASNFCPRVLPIFTSPVKPILREIRNKII